MMDKLPVVKVAAVQAEPVTLDRDASTEKACRLIAEAASNGASLVVFSEMFIPVFTNASIWGRGFAKWGSPNAQAAFARLWGNSVEIPGPITERLGEAVQAAGVTLAIGVCERVPHARTLYNTILFIGPDGSVIGRHRKLVPTNTERMIHGYGDGSTLTVFDTAAGKIGGLICWENLMPLARYALYSQGEQIHVASTSDDSEMAIVNARNTAFEGGVFVVSVANLIRKASYPSDFEFADELAAASDDVIDGGTCIIAPDGRLLVGPVYKEEAILYADLDLNETVMAGQLFDVAGHYSRPEVLGLRLTREPYTAVAAG
ncbi:nitrilase [Microvirga sp. KLBC 81]|uniref:carbon-nitrogen hydrolase family protein n=1 Tax=Microvirga sp. KLBC 81 TaxID=1862707 RepID=UPI000D5101BF|nr:carbon-nitrogen hydrolase family protein [Microvirga sp. KLBC 81]PVE21138.1 nitrilase [Microvirga sp. KLBC 81]